MKDDSLYILAVVAVVAVVGLIIMATSNTVVAQDSLPDIIESDSSALAGQAGSMGGIQATYCNTDVNAIINEVQTIGVEAFLENLVCSCEDINIMIQNLLASPMDERLQAELLDGLYTIYHEECSSLETSISVTSTSESSGFDQEVPRYDAGLISTNDIMDTFWDSLTEYSKDEYVDKDSMKDTSRTGDCTKLAETIEQAVSQQDVQTVLDDASEYCTCTQIRTEYADYEGEWSQTWTLWMMQHCMQIRLLPR